MIVYPEDWGKVGQPIALDQIEQTMERVVSEIDCDNLSFSGGIDSSLLLYWMLRRDRKVRVFTVVCNMGHPDVDYAVRTLKYFQRKFNILIDSSFTVYRTGVHGDEAVAAYYRGLALKGVKDIIAGDGVDELMCGYYPHQQNPSEKTYYEYLRKMQDEQLIPLNENSGEVKVHLPYIDKRVVDLLVRVPVGEKVNQDGRKLLMQQIAQGKVPQYVIERRKYGFCTIS